MAKALGELFLSGCGGWGWGGLGKWKEKEILWFISSPWFLSSKNQSYLQSCFFSKLDTVSHWRKRRRSVIQKVEIDPKDLLVLWLKTEERRTWVEWGSLGGAKTCYLHNWRQRNGGPERNEEGLGVAETCHPHDWRQRIGGPGWNEEGLGTVSKNLLEINVNWNLIKTQDPK